MTDFQKELLSLINRHSKENESNTPDFIIADYLIGCLKVFSESVNNRTLWYAKSSSPVQALTTDEEAAERLRPKGVNRGVRWKEGFKAGCTHVRAQQPVDAVALVEWVVSEGYVQFNGEHWINEDYPDKDWLTTSQLLALFSSQTKQP